MSRATPCLLRPKRVTLGSNGLRHRRRPARVVGALGLSECKEATVRPRSWRNVPCSAFPAYCWEGRFWQRRFAWLPWRSADVAHLTAPDPTQETDRCLAVERALAQLPPRYRAPLLLHSHYGFSVQEVAQALNISKGAVKTSLYRAREMFRQVYEGEDIA